MPYFEYSKSIKDVEYYEILEMLMERWEFEIVACWRKPCSVKTV